MGSITEAFAYINAKPTDLKLVREYMTHISEDEPLRRARKDRLKRDKLDSKEK